MSGRVGARIPALITRDSRYLLGHARRISTLGSKRSRVHPKHKMKDAVANWRTYES